jgi:hypothetical protein
VLAVLSTITIIHRIAYTYQQTRIIDLKAAEARAAEVAAQQKVIAASRENPKPENAKPQGRQTPATDSAM